MSEFAYHPEAAPWSHMACKSDGTQLEETSHFMCHITFQLNKLPRTLNIMQEVFTGHFLELNWKPLKTECVLHMVGRGMKHAWKIIERSAEQRAKAGTGAAKHVCRTLGGIECNIVPCYKHVGWSMVSEDWNASFKRAWQLQTELSGHLRRNL